MTCNFVSFGLYSLPFHFIKHLILKLLQTFLVIHYILRAKCVSLISQAEVPPFIQSVISAIKFCIDVFFNN